MKGFFSAAAASLVSGLAVLVVTPYFNPTKPASPPRAEIALSKTDEFLKIDRNKAEAIARYFSSGGPFERRDADELELSTASVENTGQVDAKNFTVTIKSSVKAEAGDILTYGLTNENPEALAQDVKIANSGDKITATFPLLRKGEKLQFWYLFSPYNISDISARIPDFEVINGRSLTLTSPDVAEDNNEFPWGIVVSVFFALASLLFGIGITAYFYDEMLRKVGFDPKEIQELYSSQQKKE